MQFLTLTAEDEILELISAHNVRNLPVVLDLETTSKHPREARVLDIQMSGLTEESVVMFDGKFLHLLASLHCPLVLHNYKYDFHVAYLNGTDLRGKQVRDTMLMHHLVDETAAHDLDSIVQEKWDDDYKAKFWAKYESYEEATPEDKLDYGCRDIVYTGRLYRLLVQQLGGMDCLVDSVHRLAACLLDTEIEGIAVDMPYLTELGIQLKTDIASTEQNLRVLGGHDLLLHELRLWREAINECYSPKGRKYLTLPQEPLNFTSTQQVMGLLYDRLGLPVQTGAKTKKPTADDAALEALEDKHPLIPELRKLRKYTKMYGSFIEGIADRMQDGRIYPSFNVNGTETGRISHSNPNLGQIPAKGEWSKIRGVFAPNPGCKILTCDYGQLEVCIAAHYSGDENLLKIINDGASQHDITAVSLGIPRSSAKTLNFAMQYLCSPFKVSELLDVSSSEAQYIWGKYWEAYKGLKAFIDETIAGMEKTGQVETLYGRVRHFHNYARPKWADPEKGSYTKEMRQAFNARIQGSGADMTSRAFYHIAELLARRGWGRGLFTVHDEVLVEVVAGAATEAKEALETTMLLEGKILRVPLKVDASEPLDRWEK